MWWSPAALGSLSGTLLGDAWTGISKGDSGTGRQHGRLLGQKAKRQAGPGWEKTNPQWQQTPTHFCKVPSTLSAIKISLSNPQN